MASFQKLPPELLLQVEEHLGQDEVRDLCLTCRQVSAVMIPQLYVNPIVVEAVWDQRHLPPLPKTATQVFFETVFRRRALRRRVLTLTLHNVVFLDLAFPRKHHGFGLFYRKIFCALPRCTDFEITFAWSNGDNSLGNALHLATRCAPKSHTVRVAGFDAVGALDTRPRGLKSLILTEMCASEVVSSVTTAATGRLKTLHLVTDFECRLSIRCLADIGSTLTTLVLSTEFIAEADVDRASFRLAVMLPRLRTLKLDIEECAWLLDDEPYPSLRNLQLNFRLCHETIALRRGLNDDLFPSLKTLGAVCEPCGGGVLGQCRGKASAKKVRWIVNPPYSVEDWDDGPRLASDEE